MWPFKKWRTITKLFLNILQIFLLIPGFLFSSTIFKLPIYTNIKNVHKIIKLSTIEEKLDSMLKTYVINKEKSISFQSIIAQMKQTSSDMHQNQATTNCKSPLFNVQN